MYEFCSQFGEDMYVFNRFINKINDTGTFVELGALNGITYSISLFFERYLNFKGILIEPTYEYNELIVNRPKCYNFNYAINYTNDKSLFLGTGACSGLVETMSENFKNTHHRNSNNTYYVNCKPMKEIIESTDIKYIDLLIIDVEGAEKVVLETMDFSIPIYVIIIELDGHNVEKDNICREILIKNGFTLDIRVSINEFWINNNYFRKDILYDETIPKINFDNLSSRGFNRFIDFNHYDINELRDSLLIQ